MSRKMLEAGDEAVDAIAGQIGYLDPAFFRRLLERRPGITAARYRFRNVRQSTVAS